MRRIISFFLALGAIYLHAQNSPPRIHVFVALCDNAHQGIVPVPARLGNGQDPAQNLYWGAGYGVRTHFRRLDKWQELPVAADTDDLILERVAFQHKSTGAILLAEAFDGAHMKETLEAFLTAAAGGRTDSLCINGQQEAFGAGAQLLAFVGHNGLMEVWPQGDFLAKDSLARELIMLACYSKPYFAPYVDSTGAKVLLWSTHLMAPEAYTLADALEAWLMAASPSKVADAAAAAYHQYQKCGYRAARRLLVSGGE